MRLILILLSFTCFTIQLSAQGSLRIEKDSNLVVYWNQDTLLQFYAAIKQPPAGADPAYQRSGFIHPLKSVQGETLTAIQPPDHYHHYGLWNPWTHTLLGRDTVDFWNLAKKQGTVKFLRFENIEQGKDQVSFTAVLSHIRFNGKKEEPVLLEQQTITVHRPDANGSYIIDFESVQQSVSAEPLKLLQYRYGGFTWRANRYWNPRSSSVLTSERKTRSNADSTRARWLFAQGFFPSGSEAGMLIMDNPANVNFPQPVRVWPDGPGDNPELMINFSPTKNTDLEIDREHPLVLRYRMLLYDGEITAAIADQYWNAYASQK